jgi:hypothetical protein
MLQDRGMLLVVAFRRWRHAADRQYAEGQIPADKLCALSHYVSAAGGKGLEDFNIGPESDNLTKNAARHVALVLEKEFKEPDFYDVLVPMHDKKQVIRAPTLVSCRLPHECILDDHVSDPVRVAEFEQENPNFYSSELAVTSGYPKTSIIPISLYWDGVRYTKNDGFVGLYTENLLSKRKYLIAAIRTNLSRWWYTSRASDVPPRGIHRWSMVRLAAS